MLHDSPSNKEETEVTADQMIHDLQTHHIQLMKNGFCVLECTLDEFLSNPSLYSRLAESHQKYLALWQEDKK